MVNITIGCNIILYSHELPSQLKTQIKRDLTIPNPEYQRALRFGKKINKLDRYLFLWYEDFRLILPRGYGPKLVSRLQGAGVEYTILDKRLTLPSVKFDCAIKLRDYQKPAAIALYKHRQGGICAPCGSGKTEIMLAVIGKVGQPALWLTHTRELLEQTKARAAQGLNLNPKEIGVIAEGKCVIGEKFTVALVQTLSKINISEIYDKFGLVAIDEAHHLPASKFYNTVCQFPALYRIWCTATPVRADGLTPMIEAAGGSLVYTIGQNEIPVIVPQLIVVETGYDGHFESYPELLNDLTRNEARNRLIIETIAREAPGNYSLVLSERIEHLKTLQQMLQEMCPNLRSELLTGQMPKKKRLEVMEQIQARKIDVVFATQLAREGLDIRHLNRLFLVCPKRAGGALQQEVGRIMRTCEDKKDAIVFDFWDTQSPILKAQFWPRREIYQKLGISFGRANVRTFEKV